MAVGDQSDMLTRLQRLLPTGWFGDSNPIRDALLWGCAQAQAWCYTLYLYAQAQTRIKTATDSWLDLIALDFFGDSLTRSLNQGDNSYRSTILVNLFRERTTRHAMEQVLLDLTGRAPVIVEPARPADVGAYGAAVAVSRASTASYFDLAGVMRYAAPNVARYDTDPATLVSKGLLMEGASSNLVLRSQEFDNSNWTKTRCAVTANAVVAPDGTLTADKLIEDSSLDTHFASRTQSVSGAMTYTWSVFLKAAERTFAMVQIGSFANQVASNVIYVNLITGAFGASDASRTTVQMLTNGWIRISTTVTTVAAPSGLVPSVYVSNALGTVSYQGDGVSGIYVWGGQFEQSGTSSSYIPTTSAVASRSADTLLTNMPTNSSALGGYQVAGAYGSLSLAYQAFVTAYRPAGQGVPYIAGYRTSTGGYSTPSRSDYAQYTADGVSDADIYAAIAATKAEGTAVWARISN